MNRQKIYPWLTLVCCCLCYGCSVGLILNTCGIFLSPVAEGLQVGIGSVSIYVTLQSLSGAFGTTIVARLIRKVKLQYLMLFGVAVSFGCFLMMRSAQSVYVFYLAGILMGSCSTTFQALPCTCTIQNWFHSKTSLVTSMAMAFSGIFGAIMSPILSNIIVATSWRNAYFVDAILLLVLMIPCILFMRLTPHEYGLLPYGAEEKVEKKAATGSDVKVSTLTFVTLIVLTMCFYCVTSFGSHVPKYAISVGYTLTAGATLTSVAMISNVSFKLIYGVVADRFGAFKATLLSGFVCLCSSILWLTIAKGSFATMILASACFGACYSIAAVGVSVLSREIAGPSQYAAVYSKVVLINSIASASMITLNGVMYDAFGSYIVSILLVFSFNIIGILATFVLAKRHQAHI